MATSIPAPISLVPSFPLNGTMTSMTENYLWSFSLSPNGISTFKEHPTLLPSSPTIRTCPTSKILVNSLVDRPTGLFSYRTSILSGKFSLVPNSLLLTPFPAIIKSTPPPTIPTPLLSRNLWLSMLLISPLPVTSNRLPQPTPSYFTPSRTYQMTPPSFCIPHSLTGLSTMDTYIIRGGCTYLLRPGPPFFTPSLLPPSQVTSDVSIPKLLLNTTSGGQDFPCLLTTFVNRTKPIYTP